jgi:glutamate/tyrosine decarboxylase-like PLP-dependent enzyme
MSGRASETELIASIERQRAASAGLELTGRQFRDECGKALELLAPFVDGATEAPGFPARASSPLAARLPAGDGGAIHQLVRAQLDGGIETASGNFMGYIPGGGLLSGALADLVVAVTNRFAGFEFTAPGAARAENQVIHWLCELFGLGPEAWGSLTSGATMATLNCLLAARESAGGTPVEKLGIYLTDQAHHSVNRTLRTLGLHRARIATIAVDERLRLRPEELGRAIEEHRARGIRPFLVVATAGTTNTGAVDPLDTIAELSRRHALWLHVDAAYGGCFALCERTRPLLRGIERADSLVVDPHKGLFLPYGVGAGLVRDHRRLKAALHEEAPYLARAEAPEERSPADYSFELTRHNRAPRIQLSLELFGLPALRAALDEKLLLAELLHHELGRIPGIELHAEPELSIVAFRATAGDDATQAMLESILADGQTHVSSTRIRDRLWVRACILSFRTHLEHVRELVRRVGNHASSGGTSP